MIEEQSRFFANGSNRLDAKPHRISDLLEVKPAEAAVSGVYLISAPDAPGQIVYAGRTKSKTILGRLVDHCGWNTASDLVGMLVRHPEFCRQAKSYSARWLRIEDNIERAQVELFAIAVLRPPFNRHG
jgi:hypothetical protein